MSQQLKHSLSYLVPFSFRRFARVLVAFALTVPVLFGAGLVLPGCTQRDSATQKVEQLYTYGMHPQVIQNKPGNCPICGMKLTPVRKQAGPGTEPNYFSCNSR